MTTDSKHPWIVLFALSLLSLGFIAYAIFPASIFPIITNEFGIEKSTASASITLVFLSWAILQIPGGYILDKYDNRRMLIHGSIFYFLSSFMGLLASEIFIFMITRLLSGIGVVFIFVGSMNILSKVLPEKRRALGISLFVSSPPVGVAVALSSGAWLTGLLGWKGAFTIYLAISLIGFTVYIFTSDVSVSVDDSMSFHLFLDVFRNKSVIFISIASFVTYTIWTFLTSWMPTYGNEVIGLDLTTAGVVSALVPIGGIISRPLGGWISELLGGKLQPIIISSFIISMVLLIVISITGSVPLFILVLLIAGGSVNLSVGLYIVYIKSVTDKNTSGTSLSVMMTFSQIGNLTAPVLGGWLISDFSWSVAFGYTIFLIIIGIVAILLVEKYNPD